MSRPPPPPRLQLSVLRLGAITAGCVSVSLVTIFAQARWSVVLGMWTTAGCSVAATMLYGSPAALAVFASVLLVGLALGHLTTIPQLSLGLAVAWSLQAALVATILRRLSISATLARLRDVAGFALAAYVGAAVSASFFVAYTAAACRAGRADLLPATPFGAAPCARSLGSIFWTRLLADGVTITCSAPLLLALHPKGRRRPLLGASRRGLWAHGVGLWGVAALTWATFFAGTTPAPARTLLGPALLFPVLMGVVIYNGRTSSLLCVSVASSLGLYATQTGRGPFALLPVERSVLVVELYTMMLTLTTLVFAAVVEEKDDEIALREKTLSVVSRDLRGPVRAVRERVDSLIAAAAAPRPAAVARGLAHIDATAQRMDALINDLLDVARVQAHRLSLRPQSVSPAALLHTVATAHRAAHADGHPRLVVEAHLSAAACVRADPERLAQVLTNLLRVAADETPAGDSVVLEAADSGPCVSFAVVGGCTDPTLTPLARGGEALSMLHGFGEASTGLALFLVHGILEAHGSRLALAARSDRRMAYSFALACP